MIAKVWKFLAIILIVSSERSTSIVIPNKFENYDLVHFNLIHGNYRNFSRYYIRDYLRILSDENFSFDRKTLMYVHGWIEDFYSESVETVVNSYIQRQDHNIIIIDWGAYSFGEYFSVIPRFTQISKTIAKLLVDLFERGLDINQLHCVGHSFGSHIFGIAGRELNRISYGKYKLPRISALDPAHFGFWPPLLELPLSPSDAVFVDAIHTDVNFIGTRNRVGHVDFYPNDGIQVEAGCPPFRFFSYMDLVNSFCSHQHAWRYWSESAKPGQERAFQASSCGNYKDFKDGKCIGNRINFMGYGAQSSNPGVYYLELQSSRNYTVGDSYFDYLATSLNYRSDLVRIVARLQQFFSILTQKMNKL